MRFSLLIVFSVLQFLLRAQAPALIPYQAIARNAAGEPLASSTLNARFTIHDGTASGTNVWQELQTVSTTSLGLFTVQLGSSVALTGVNWANGAKFMQVEIDLGQGFVDMGTQQFLSVPYALYGNAAGNGFAGVSAIGDTLYLANGNYLVVPGISLANDGFEGTSEHTCGASNLHNPELSYGSMYDYEGNVYKTIVIGTQEWMAENLNTSFYRNGDAISTSLDNASWKNTTSGAWAYYMDDASYACPFGKLYNWYACVDPRELCPVGWHVPTDAEWSVLTTYLGGEVVVAGKMKTTGILAAGTGFWGAPNTAASNSSGFSAAPGGYRLYTGDYWELSFTGYWWSSSESNADRAFCRNLLHIDGYSFLSDVQKPSGLSVRCLRD
jgi:uncharacterized protein (TIGR02145 family)